MPPEAREIRYLGGSGSNYAQEDFEIGSNFDFGRKPIDDEILLAEAHVFGILYGLDQSALRLKEFHWKQSATGLVGLADTPFKLAHGVKVFLGEHYGIGSPAGSTRINLQLVASTGDAPASEIIVHNSASSSSDNNLPPVRLVVDDADTIIRVRRGRVGIASRAAEESLLDKLEISWVTGRASDADVHVGDNVIMDTVEKQGGMLKTESGAVTSMTNHAGTLMMDTADNTPLIIVWAGTANLDRFGTITDLEARGGLIDLTRTTIARTITNLKLWPGATVLYDPGYVTIDSIAPQEAMKISTSGV